MGGAPGLVPGTVGLRRPLDPHEPMKTRFNPLQTAASAAPSPALPKPKARQNAPNQKKPQKSKRERRPVDAAEALSRAANGQSLANYPAIFEGFALKGIPADQIKPRENVFTFDAWRALGRTVRRGEHGVRVVTMVPCGGKEEVDPATGEVTVNLRTRPWRSTVFHVSQTDPIGAGKKSVVSAPATPEPERKPASTSSAAVLQTPQVVPINFTPAVPETPVPINQNEKSASDITPIPAATPAAPALGGWRSRFATRQHQTPNH